MNDSVDSRELRVADERRSLPHAPGVYLFHDREGEVIYVGKARSLKKRVASHFSGGNSEMTGRVETIEFLVTDTEAEALLAEQTFIKRHRPRFNVRLRDDKSYPYIGVSLDEKFPRVYFTRERHRPGRSYYGPFSSARRVRETLDLLGKLFRYRTCTGTEPGRRSGSPCLDYYIDRCGAPCVGYVDAAEYRAGIDIICDFLSGRYREIADAEERKMRDAAEAHEFERASIHRDRLEAIRSLFERQGVTGSTVGTADVIGIAVEGTDANAQVFQVRDGILTGRQSFYLENRAERDRGEVAEEFIGQYYSASPSVPRTVVVGGYLSESLELLEAALTERRGAAVAVRMAERGERRRIQELTERNASLALGQETLRREHRRRRRTEALTQLADALDMEQVPIRIEGYDISNLGGDHTVASMVVFEEGRPKKSDYRRFKIRGDRAGGPDDFASMEEVLDRRIRQYLEQEDLSPHDAERDASFAALPSLILIDGGPGQLSAGLRSLQPLVDRGATVASIAKRAEEVFLPGRRGPIDLASDSEASRLLQRVRDESHRFAITHHRGVRSKDGMRSVLDELRGVGPVRKRALIRHFGSPDRLISASREEIEAVPELPGKVARDIHDQLNRIG